jgi:hypothetical protein
VETPTELKVIAENLGLLSNTFNPRIPEWFEKALTRLGGKNPHGEPNFRVVSGQMATRFAWGKTRLKYPAAFINETKTLGFDVLYADGSTKFFKQENDIPELKQGDIVMPRVSARREEIGIPRWVIERWQSPEQLGGEDEWQKNRYEFDAETNELVDALGPFPRDGQYRHFLTVQTKDKQFRELGPDVLDIIERVLRVQEKMGLGKSYEQAVREEVEEMKAKEKKRIAEFGERWKDAFNTPRIMGNAMVSVPDGMPTLKKVLKQE